MDKKISNEQKSNFLKKIRSKNVLKEIFFNLNKYKYLEIIKYNKYIQNKIEIGLNDYKEYLKTEIEIIPRKNRAKKPINFINVSNEKRSSYHIYFNDSTIETKRTDLTKNDDVSKIKIILDYEFKSFKGLFSDCNNCDKIIFKKINRRDIKDMSYMFNYCKSLRELNISLFNTEKVTNMSYMFYFCESLKELNLSNFNTINVTDMKYMFFGGYSLIKLNISNFNTINVKDMAYMFAYCSELKELDLSNFTTRKVKNMCWMFYACAFNNLDISNFNIKKDICMEGMFADCSDELIALIKKKYKKIKKEAF